MEERKTMKVISKIDLYVSLKTGDAVRLYAGEAREFPEYIGYACLQAGAKEVREEPKTCLLYTSPSPRDLWISRMPSSA